MAIYYARKAGNINATDVWATTPAGVAGDVFGSFTTSDTLMLNNFAITLNTDVSVLEIRNDNANSATAGGSMPFTTSRVVTANIVASGTMFTSSTSSISLTINGNVTASGAGSPISMTGNGQSIFINGNTTVNSSGAGIVHNIGSGVLSSTININGTITTNSGGNGLHCYGSNTGGLTISCGAITVNGSGDGVIIDGRNISSLTVNGNIVSTLSGNGMYLRPTTSPGTVLVDGDVTGGTVGEGIQFAYIDNNAPLTVTITGNVTAGSTSTGHGITIADGSTITIQGDVTSTVNGGNGVLISGAVVSNVTIEGDCIGGLSEGAYNNSNGSTLTIEGVVYGGPLAASNVGARANTTGALVYIYKAAYGTLGASPTSGPIRFVDATSNSMRVYIAPNSPSTKTLVDAAIVTSVNPSDVRDGVLYDNGTQEGTLVVPVASTVLNGVVYDNGTTGTLIMTASDFWGTQTSSLNISGSIGERLKNAATIASTGQQLSDALNGL